MSQPRITSDVIARTAAELRESQHKAGARPPSQSDMERRVAQALRNTENKGR